MDKTTDLQIIIKQLIEEGKEGDYWDFKECHHEKAGDLIHDVICFANTIRHQGDRYIIFGVTDNGIIKDKETNAQKRNQSDIINTLSQAGFAGNSYPDVFLKEIIIDGKNIDVLIIKDKPEKPYYLQKEYNNKGVKINPGTIYTRIRDANTPKNQVAPAPDIEKMWRERFGLSSTPLERVKIYLQDFNGWEETLETEWHYKQFPEFTVTEIVEDIREVIGGESWVRSAINPKAFVSTMRVKYHQTVLKNVCCIYYDEMRYITPAPKPTFIELYTNNKEWFYSICADSFDFFMLQFLTKREAQDLLHNGINDRYSFNIPVIIFSLDVQKDSFVNHLKGKKIQYNVNPSFSNDPIVTDYDRKIIEYSKAVIDIFQSWKEHIEK